jgi:uncharacterized protein (PEP-CTERM system associated)
VSSGYDEAFFDSDNLGLRVYYGAAGQLSYALSRTVNTEINGSYRYNDYVNTDPERTDRISIFGGGLIFTPLEFLSARVNYQHRYVDSSEESNEYRENRLSFSITLRPEQPFYLQR